MTHRNKTCHTFFDMFLPQGSFLYRQIMPENLQKRDTLVKEAFRYRDALVSYAFGILRDWAAAQDVVQDAFLVVMNKWTEFASGSVYAWVRKIVYYKAMEALRARQKEVKMDENTLESVIHDCLDRFMDENAAEKQILMRKALQECMAKLNKVAIEILAGFYAHLKPCEELALIHKRSVNAIRLMLSRVRKELHECMAGKLRTEMI